MRARALAAVVLFVAFAGGACSAGRAPTEPTSRQVEAPPTALDVPRAIDFAPTAHADPTIDSLSALPDRAAWRRVAATSDEHAIARTEVVKVLVDLARDELHFCQSERWPLHYDFVLAQHPDERARYASMRAFMTRNYLRPDRAYVMASVVHVLDADAWVLELGPADTLDADGIRALLARLRAHAFFGESLRFHPRSARQIETARAAGLDVVDGDALFAGVHYQPVTLGRARGRVQLVRGPLDGVAVAPDAILVVGGTPDELPPIRALVTAELQTPLAHVAVLSASRGTPDMALRGVLEDAAWRAFDGRWATLTVTARGYTLEPADGDDATALQPSLARTIPPADPTALALEALTPLTLADLPRVGAKAAQLAEVRRLGLPTLDGFVVPTGRYVAHLAASGVDAHAPLVSSTDRATLAAALATRRARLEATEVDPALLAELAARARRLARDAHTDRVILRSSTNAEDLPGWSGAGLYDSVAARADDPADLAHALRAVWASVWTARAYDERRLAGVEHAAVAMAVLVQPFLGDARALGVALTENPHARRRASYLVDLAPRGHSVTASEAALPEEWLLHVHSSPELVHRATGRADTLLDAASALALRDRLTTLHDGMRALWLRRDPSSVATAVDAELALDAGGEVVFLQARPFTHVE